jgi:FixJ family two-component response regulator
MATRALVSVVDDDESVRESLPDLIKEFGFAVQVFPSAEAFLASEYVDLTDCLILDVAMPGMPGFELQQVLERQGRDVPIVFITAHGNAASRTRAMSQGAAGYLLKPFSAADLLDALNSALKPK